MIPRRMIDDVIRRNPQDPTDLQQDNATVIQPRMSPYGQNVENANNGDISSIVPSRTPEQANALYAPQAQMGHADLGSSITQAGGTSSAPDLGSLAPRNRMDNQTSSYMQEDYNNGLKYSLPPAIAPPADRYQAEQTPVLDPHSRALAEPGGTYKAPGLKGRLWEGAKAFLMGGGIQGAMRGLFDVYGREKHDQDIAQRTEDLANQDKQLIQRNQANLGAEKFNDLQSAREQDRALQERQFQQSNENHSITERRQQQALADKEEASSIAQRLAQEKIDASEKNAKTKADQVARMARIAANKNLLEHLDPNSDAGRQALSEYTEDAGVLQGSPEGKAYLQRMQIKTGDDGTIYGVNPLTGGVGKLGDKGLQGQSQAPLRVTVINNSGGGRGGGSPTPYDDVESQRVVKANIRVITEKLSDRDKSRGVKPKTTLQLSPDVFVPINPGEDPHDVALRNAYKMSEPVRNAFFQVYKTRMQNQGGSSSISSRPSVSAFSGNPTIGNQ